MERYGNIFLITAQTCGDTVGGSLIHIRKLGWLLPFLHIEQLPGQSMSFILWCWLPSCLWGGMCEHCQFLGWHLLARRVPGAPDLVPEDLSPSLGHITLNTVPSLSFDARFPPLKWAWTSLLSLLQKPLYASPEIVKILMPCKCPISVSQRGLLRLLIVESSGMGLIPNTLWIRISAGMAQDSTYQVPQWLFLMHGRQDNGLRIFTSQPPECVSMLCYIAQGAL